MKQEADIVATRTITWTAILSIVVMVGALVFAWRLLAQSAPPTHVDRLPAPRAAASSGAELRDAQRASLERWRWVDRDAGIAEIPIERAMDVVAGGTR